MKTWHLSILISIILISGCSGSSVGPCPKDQELMDRFSRHSAEFEKLLDAQRNDELVARLGIEKIFPKRKQPLEIWFAAWEQDFVGPGGCYKGYAYSEATPSVVLSIDDNSSPGSPEIKSIYRHITGCWYLFYHSDN